MPKTRLIQFRVSRLEHERIYNNARAKGFRTISGYIRHIALNRDLVFEKMFNEMYEVIMKKKR